MDPVVTLYLYNPFLVKISLTIILFGILSTGAGGALDNV